MKRELQISIIWLALMVSVWIVLSHSPYTYSVSAVANISLQLLIAVVCFAIAYESKTGQRYVFFNLGFQFSWIIPLCLSALVGTVVFAESTDIRVGYYFYVNKVAMSLFTLFPIVYIVIDYLKPAWRVRWKYSLGLIVSGIALLIVFQGLLFRPGDLYEVKDYREYEILSSISRNNKAVQVPLEINNDLVRTFISFEGVTRGHAYSTSEATSRLAFLKPYFDGDMEKSLFWKPAYEMANTMNLITVMVLGIALIALMTRIRVAGGYMDKILLVLFLMMSVEVFHVLSFIGSTSKIAFAAMKAIGSLFTVGMLLLLLFLLTLKLRFLLSSVGKYYEERVYSAPETVTIWRDPIDRFIIAYFMKPYKSIMGIRSSVKEDGGSLTNQGVVDE